MVELYARTACATVLCSTVLYSPPTLTRGLLPSSSQAGRKEGRGDHILAVAGEEGPSFLAKYAKAWPGLFRVICGWRHTRCIVGQLTPKPVTLSSTCATITAVCSATVKPTTFASTFSTTFTTSSHTTSTWSFY